MTFPDFAHAVHYVNLAGVQAAEVRDRGSWVPGRISIWLQDQRGWHCFFWPELDHYRAGAPHGWLRLDDVRPGVHETRVTRSPVGPQPDDIDPSWWPPDDHPPRGEAHTNDQGGGTELSQPTG